MCWRRLGNLLKRLLKRDLKGCVDSELFCTSGATKGEGELCPGCVYSDIVKLSSVFSYELFYHAAIQAAACVEAREVLEGR